MNLGAMAPINVFLGRQDELSQTPDAGSAFSKTGTAEIVMS